MSQDVLLNAWDNLEPIERDSLKKLSPFNLSVYFKNTNKEINLFSLDQIIPAVVDFIHSNYGKIG
jgi:hypothetical protein